MGNSDRHFGAASFLFCPRDYPSCADEFLECSPANCAPCEGMISYTYIFTTYLSTIAGSLCSFLPFSGEECAMSEDEEDMSCEVAEDGEEKCIRLPFKMCLEDQTVCKPWNGCSPDNCEAKEETEEKAQNSGIKLF